MPAVAQNRTYRIGHDDPFEPFAFVENGRSRGLPIDIVAAILSHGGVAFDYRPLSLTPSRPSWQQGRSTRSRSRASRRSAGRRSIFRHRF
jgi:hypothetical protein